jgi:hypothetical protein
MQNQKDVKWGERGFWLLFNDWVDLAPFYGESRDHDYASNAEKIFGGDTREWFEGNMGNTEPGDAWSEINDSNMSLIRQLLVNRTVYNSDGEEHTVTRDNSRTSFVTVEIQTIHARTSPMRFAMPPTMPISAVRSRPTTMAISTRF